MVLGIWISWKVTLQLDDERGAPDSTADGASSGE
jgi:hypothetical protein